METPKVFISYCWSNPEHEQWVINLAERLTSDGVEVVIDKWNLKEGQDKYHFMETMVKSDDINRVLIILDKKYKEKAEMRKGGVGTETQIISPEIYSNVLQEKFIPISKEKDENDEPYVPTYLKGKIYVDLSDNYEDNYEILLRNIFKRPANRKPKLGKPPEYLFEESPMSHKTSNIIRAFKNQISKNPERVNSFTREFLEQFYNDLKGFSISFSERNVFTFGKAIYDNITSYTPLRNDFISFFDFLTREGLSIDVDIIIRFFEKLPLLTKPQEDRSSWSDSEFDNFRFFIHEIFLYTVAVGLKNENYKFVEELLYSSYFFKDKYSTKSEPQRFDQNYNAISIIDTYYNETYSKKYISPMADLIITRVPEGWMKDIIIDSDLLCYYISVIENLRWFPITYIYKENRRFELFERLISLRHFEKVKLLFNVKTIMELRNKLNEIKQKDNSVTSIGYSNAFSRVIPIYNLIDIDKIGSLR